MLMVCTHYTHTHTYSGHVVLQGFSGHGGIEVQVVVCGLLVPAVEKHTEISGTVTVQTHDTLQTLSISLSLKPSTIHGTTVQSLPLVFMCVLHTYFYNITLLNG